jgi:hypothetical protein
MILGMVVGGLPISAAAVTNANTPMNTPQYGFTKLNHATSHVHSGWKATVSGYSPATLQGFTSKATVSKSRSTVEST